MTFRSLALLTTCLSALALAGQAMAQEPPPPPAAQQEIAVTDDQLVKFADAQQEIVQIQQDFSGRLQGVEDPDEAHQLQVQANEEMTTAVRDAGLDVESFNQIAVAVQNDAELQQRLSQIMEQ